MAATSFNVQDVLQFWFPLPDNCDLQTLTRQWEWWFCAGADSEIIAHFQPLLAQAIADNLDSWSSNPQSRLALIIILDQFSRAIYRGTAQAFAQDAKACSLALEGLYFGHYATLKTPWEKTFFLLPLRHSENLRNLNLAVKLADTVAQEALPEYRQLLTFLAAQVRRHRDVIARFGRHPHRNDILGRLSTREEKEYLANNLPIHPQPLPSQFAYLLASSLR